MKFKEHKEIDNLIKSKLVDKEFVITPERLIEINKQLDTLPRPKSRKVFYYYTSLGVLFFILTLGFCLKTPKKEGMSTVVKSSEKSQKNTENSFGKLKMKIVKITGDKDFIISGNDSHSNIEYPKPFPIKTNKESLVFDFGSQVRENKIFKYLKVVESNLTSRLKEFVSPIENEELQFNTEQNCVDTLNKVNDVDEYKLEEQMKIENTRFWSIYASTGVSLVTKKIVSGPYSYQFKRSMEEKSIFTSQFEVGFNYDLRKIRLSTGLNFIQYGEGINYSGIASDSTYISSYTDITDSAGNTITVPNYTTVTYTDSTLLKSNGVNRHTYLTIPLSMGYQFNTSIRNFSITPKVGIGLRFLVEGNGKYSSADLSSVQVLRDKPISLSYHWEMQFSYKSDNISFFVTPNYNGALHSFNSIHRYKAIGAMFGVIYHP